MKVFQERDSRYRTSMQTRVPTFAAPVSFPRTEFLTNAFPLRSSKCIRRPKSRRQFYQLSPSCILLPPRDTPAVASPPERKQVEILEDGRSVLGSSGVIVPPMWFGAWKAGLREWGTAPETFQVLSAIRAAMMCGMNAFDTSERYGNGKSEELIAEALKGVYREKYVVSTGIDCTHLGYNEVRKSCEDSLRRLNTEYIDLLYVHWPSQSFGSPDVPWQYTMEAMYDLVQEGYVRAVGVSNYDFNTLNGIGEYVKLDAIQAPHNLFWRSAETYLIPYCVEQDIPLLDYSPLAQGLLAVAFSPSHEFKPWDNDIRKRNKLFYRRTNWANAQRALKELDEFRMDFKCTTAQMALAWCLNRRVPLGAQPPRVIVGSTNDAHIRENWAALDIRFSDTDLAELNKIGQRVTRYLDPEDELMWYFGGNKARGLKIRT